MHITLTRTMFKDAFRAADRLDNFSHEALDLLFEHFEDLEESLGESLELDVIAVCCDFMEATEEEIRQDYDIEEGYDVMAYLEDNTHVIGSSHNGYLFQNF